MKQRLYINKLIEMHEMLEKYLSNMDLLNEDGSVKEEKPTEEVEAQAKEEAKEVEPEDDEAKISDRDAIIMIRKAK